jgi:tricorn protease
MIRRAIAVVFTASVVMLAFASLPAQTPQIRLARQPDYHAGRIAFTYLGDIWTASETGSDPDRLTDHRGHDMSPKFSPDGRWIAFASNRHGNNDVFVVPATGGTPTRLTFHPGGDDVVGWTRDSSKVLIRAARNAGAFPNVATLWEVPVGGGPEAPLPVDWGAYGSYSPDGKSLAFNRHPSSWTRQHYRSSAAADLWVVNLDTKAYTQLLPNERHNRLWPMWGSDNMIYFVADPLPNDTKVMPGSADVRKSANNIYKIPAAGGQPVQVTRHPDGNLFWPSMSSDGKVIVYESMFGLWKLDVASGQTSEIRISIASDTKDNETDMEVVRNDVNSFDLSPSGKRAVISTRGQILTIATERGDVTRIAPDPMASRNQFPKWSPDGKYIAYLSDASGRDEIWISDPDGKAPKKVTNLDTEKGAIVWTPDSTALLYTAADKRLYRYTVGDDKTMTLSSTDVNRIGGVSVSPDSKWVALAKQDRTLRSHVYIVPLAGGEERHISDDRLHYSEANAVWTADGRYLVFTESEGFSNGIATQGGVATTMTLWALPLRDQERDPMDRDIDNEAEAQAAEAAARQAAGRGGAGATAPPVVQIDWNNIGRRARRLDVPGTTLGRLTPAPEGHAIALSVARAGAPGGPGGAAAGDTGAGLYVIDIETGQQARLPNPPPNNAPGGGGGGGGGFGAGAGGSGIAFARDARTIYFTSGNGLYAAPVNLAALREAPRAGGGGRGGAAPAETPAPATGGAGGGGGGNTARQVTYTANLEVDRTALRAQVFNEGWRIMKNRFYDAKMHGANWPAMREMYEQLLRHVGNTEELQNVMMMMIGQLNASHTGVSGGPNPITSNVPPRYPGFDFVLDPSGYYKVGHIYTGGPADHDYLRIAPGHFVVSLDRRPLKTTDNYWRALQVASGTKFHFMINDKPTLEGAWEVSITPANGGQWGDLQYAKWVDDRRDMVTKLSNGTIGYLHIRAMDAPSLRQFQLDLAANRTKQALVIDQRFNGGGGIDQELLAILSGRKYQYTMGRDAGIEQPRPQNFYGPMVVMQNERSGSDAEMFPAGFRALGLGKLVGVPTAAAVIGTGSYTLLDGSTIRTPGTGVWTATGQNMENYGVPPDVYVDNTPSDFLKGRDAQIEKAVEVLKGELGKKTTTSQPQR